MENTFNQQFWSDKYNNKETGWDIGTISTPLKEYFDQLTNKELNILIPGAGNAYEAEYLFKKGFKNITIVDIAEAPLQNIQQRLPDFPKENLIHKDFFKFQGSFDLIVEQTFFCALNPTLREAYVEHTHQLLKENGKLVGVVFTGPLNAQHPPFGATKEEYQKLFFKKFNSNTLEACYNSIPPRLGNELFINFQKI